LLTDEAVTEPVPTRRDSGSESARDDLAEMRSRHSGRSLIWIAAALAVALLAIAFRCWHLFTVPPGLYIDEVLTAHNALAWRLDPHATVFGSTPLLMPGWVETSNLYLAFASALMWLGNDGLLGIRLISVLPSLAAVPLLYWLGAQLGGRRAGLLAAFLLACSHWAARSGRTGWDAVLMVTLQLAALACLVHAQRRGRIGPALAAGALLGLSLYTYVASRLVLLHACLWLTWEGIALLRRQSSSSDAHRAAVQQALVRTLAFLFAIVVVASPLQQGKQATGMVRVVQLSVFGHPHPWKSILDNLLGHALMFNVRGGTYARDALPGFPMLDPITGALFLLGLFAVALPAASTLIRRLRRRRRVGAPRAEGSHPRAAVFGEHGWDTDRQAGAPTASPNAQPPSRQIDDGMLFRLLLTWPAVMVIGGILSTSGEGPPYPYRVLSLAPWACLVAAIGGVALWDFVSSRAAPVVRGAVAALALLSVVAVNAWVLFLAGPRDPGTRHVYGTAATRLGLWLADHAEGRPVFILPDALVDPPLPRSYAYAPANPSNFFRPADQLAAVQLASHLRGIELRPALPANLTRAALLVVSPAQEPEASRRYQIDDRVELGDGDPSAPPLATILVARPRPPAH